MPSQRLGNPAITGLNLKENKNTIENSAKIRFGDK
jgi:hypothetical protein